ncbi:Zinc-binding protein A33 [Liparis tanakae]|uniref:Zinc-binding protein A33 n=1 Tax=Liparis tanakae TaxID=230148 RepID=A0A4Z2G151_9TELE|nr:Zinc-binding protein A33 [Liparis tanakae]
MAAEGVLLETSLTCPVCWESFTEPVSLRCDHSFCSSCLARCWKQGQNNNCPLCERRSSKEYPNVNLALKELSDSFAERQKKETEPEEQNPEGPVRELLLHQSPELQGPLQPAARGLGEQLRSELESLQDQRDKHRRVEDTYKEVIQHSKKQLLSTERRIRAEFNQLHRFLKEEEESRLAALRDEEEQKGKTIDREVKRIRKQISSLSDSISAVLEDLQKHNSGSKATRTRTRVQSAPSEPQLVSGALVDVAKHLGNLSFRVWEKMKGQVHFSPVILDPNTAGPSLQLSEDLTSVRRGEPDQQRPDVPERFTKYADVLGAEGFSSGTHSWEVEVGDHPFWWVGVVKESVDRKGEVPAAPEDGLWCFCNLSGEYVGVGGETVRLEKSLRRVRVRLDYDGGELTFYDPEDVIHSHRDAFTERLFPYFHIGEAGDAQTADIKICHTDVSL